MWIETFPYHAEVIKFATSDRQVTAMIFIDGAYAEIEARYK